MRTFFKYRFNRFLLGISYFFLVCSSYGQSTSFPVTVNTFVNPPYSVNFEDYTSPVTNLISTQIRLNDIGRLEYQVRLIVTIERLDGALVMSTRRNFLPPPIFLNGGVPETLLGVDLAEYFNPNNMDFRGMSRQEFVAGGARLPDGAYRICVQVVDYTRGTVVSGDGCSGIFVVLLNEPPFPNLPFNGEKLIPKDPQNIFFSWTPRHLSSPNSTFSTEYVFQLFEVRPKGRNPNDAVLTTRPIFEESTTQSQLNYGPLASPLLPGMEYVWRVQAKDLEGRDLFINNGFSEVAMFTYGDPCTVPTDISGEGSSPASVKVQWVADLSHRSYDVRYRQKAAGGRGAATWLETSSLLDDVSIYDLRPNTTYEYQVKAECIVDESGWSDIAEATTQEIVVDENFSCGVEDLGRPINNQNPLPELYPFDTIHTGGGFKVIVTESAGSNGSFSGTGIVSIPMFSGAFIQMEFSGISVNTDYRLIGGMIRTVYNEDGAQIVDVDEYLGNDEEPPPADEDTGDPVADAGGDPLPVPPSGEVTVAGTIEGADSITVTEDGTIEVTDSNGQTTTYEQPVDEDGNPEPVVVSDSAGNSYTVGSDGSVSPGGGSQSGGGPAGDDSVISDVEVTPVTFLAAGATDTKYGFDAKRDDIGTYEQLTFGEETYDVPWKSIAAGQTDFVAVTTSADDFPDSIAFRTINGPVTSQPGLNAQQQKLNLVGTFAGDVLALTAYSTIGEGDSARDVTMGQLNVVTYDQISKDLIIVPVNSASAGSAASLATEINKIFGQAVAEWNVTVDSPFNIGEDAISGLDAGESGMLASFPQKMRQFNKAFKRSRNFDNDAYYVFLVNGSGSSKKGFMPFKRQFGYIFMDNLGSTPLATAIAHELGHGAFRLEHPTSEHSRALPDNLMHNTNGQEMRKYQWDFVHDPRSVISWFQDEEESAYLDKNQEIKNFLSNLRCGYANNTLAVIKHQETFYQYVNVFDEQESTVRFVFETNWGTKVFNPSSIKLDGNVVSIEDESGKVELKIGAYNSADATLFYNYLRPSASDLQDDVAQQLEEIRQANTWEEKKYELLTLSPCALSAINYSERKSYLESLSSESGLDDDEEYLATFLIKTVDQASATSTLNDLDGRTLTEIYKTTQNRSFLDRWFSGVNRDNKDALVQAVFELYAANQYYENSKFDDDVYLLKLSGNWTEFNSYIRTGKVEITEQASFYPQEIKSVFEESPLTPIYFLADKDNNPYGVATEKVFPMPAIVASWIIEKQNAEEALNEFIQAVELASLAVGVGEISIAARQITMRTAVGRNLIRLALGIADISTYGLSEACRSPNGWEGSDFCTEWKKIEGFAALGLLSTTILTELPTITRALSDNYAKVNKAALADEIGASNKNRLDELLEAGGSLVPIRKVEPEEFFGSFEASQDVQEKAWKFFEEENWQGLYDLFRDAGVNKFDEIIWPPNHGFRSFSKFEVPSTELRNTEKFDRFQKEPSLGGGYASPVKPVSVVRKMEGADGVTTLRYTHDSRMLADNVEDGTYYFDFNFKDRPSGFNASYGDVMPWFDKVNAPQVAGEQVMFSVKLHSMPASNFDKVEALVRHNGEWRKCVMDGRSVITDLQSKINKLPQAQADELVDFLNNNQAAKDAFRNAADPEGMVDAWRFLEDAGVDDPIRKNVDALTDPDAVIDAVEASGKSKPTWSEIQALFKRGNDYNAKARIKYGANRSEIVLKGVDGKAGKRLDTYIPPSSGKTGEIISRKATTLSEIQPNTFRNYLNELITKYPKGAELNSSKFPSGTKLDGDYFLEIPTSNKSFFESSTEFQKVLSDFNTSKGVDIKIKYLAE